MILTIGFCCWFFCNGLWAEDITVRLSADDKTASLNETLVITVSVTGADRGSLGEGFLKEFSVLSRQQSTNIAMIQMKTRITKNYRFEVLPRKTGKITMGPAVYSYKGKKYKSNTIAVTISGKSSGKTGRAPKKEKNSESRQDTVPRTHARLVIEQLTPREVYINQPVHLRLSLLIKQDVANHFRQISFPEVHVENCTMRNPEENKRVHARRKIIGNEHYRSWTFNRLIIPVAAGELTVDSQLDATLAIPVGRERHPFGGVFNDDFFDDFFTRYKEQKVELGTEKKKIRVKAFPTENKPKNFEGAVGRFTMNTRISGQSVRVGEPLTMTVEIKGNGNIESVSEPGISNPEGFKIFQENPDVRKDPSDIMAGKKTFSITLVPQTPDITRTPMVEFSFFDPEKKQYRTLQSKQFPLTVQAGEKESIIYSSDQKKKGNRHSIEVLAEDIVPVRSLDRKQGLLARISPTNLNVNLIVFLAPLLIAASVRMIASHKRKLENDPSYSRKLNAWKNARNRMNRAEQAMKEEEFSNAGAELWDAVHLFVADRLSLSPGTVYGHGLIQHVRERSSSADLLDSIKEWSNAMEQMRFSGGVDKNRVERLVKETQTLLNKLRKVV